MFKNCFSLCLTHKLTRSLYYFIFGIVVAAAAADVAACCCSLSTRSSWTRQWLASAPRRSSAATWPSGSLCSTTFKTFTYFKHINISFHTLLIFFVLKYLRVSRAGRFVAGVVGCCSRRIAAATKWTLCSCRRSLYIFLLSKRDKMKKWKQSIRVNKAKALFCLS